MPRSFFVWQTIRENLFAFIALQLLLLVEVKYDSRSWRWADARSVRRTVQPDRQLTNICIPLQSLRLVRFVNLIFSQRFRALICCCCWQRLKARAAVHATPTAFHLSTFCAYGRAMIYERNAKYAERKATEFNIDGMGMSRSVGEEVAAGGRPFCCA